MDDSSSQNLQKYVYEQEDGELESKVTTVPQSKTKHYEQKSEQYISKTSKESYASPKNMKSGESHTMVMSMTEKKLNNYLSQAKYLMNNDKETKQGKSTHKLQSFSIDYNEHQNDYALDNNDYSKELFSGGAVMGTSSSNDKSDWTESMIKQSFNASKSKDEEQKKRVKDRKAKANQKDKKQQKLSKHKSSELDINQKSLQSRVSELKKKPNQKQSPTIAQSKLKKQEMSSPKLIIDQLNQVIDEEQNTEYDEFNDQYIFSIEDGKQADLGQMKSLNKRQSSKTEVNYQFGNKLGQNKNENQSSKKQIQQKQQNISHKKTTSQLQDPHTRNQQLSKKHTTTTTSPIAERFSTQPRDKLNNQKKKQQHSSRNKPASNMIAPSKTEIKEVQNEDDESERYNSMNRPISPSQSSHFQFHPKFFKPTTLPYQQLGKQSVSMEEHLTTSTLQTQQILKKDLSKKL